MKRVSCSIHPLHQVKVYANGSHTQREHAPQIVLDRAPRIIGCTCGWRIPPGTADSDDAIAMHVAIATVLR